MLTLKTRRRWARANTPEAKARTRAKIAAARMALPPPAYPATAPITGDWLGGRINGHTVIMQLLRMPGQRCDQWAASIDGEPVADAAGLTALWALLHQRWPKAASLRQRAAAGHHFAVSDS